jgi:hypothetical protein
VAGHGDSLSQDMQQRHRRDQLPTWRGNVHPHRPLPAWQRVRVERAPGCRRHASAPLPRPTRRDRSPPGRSTGTHQNGPGSNSAPPPRSPPAQRLGRAAPAGPGSHRARHARTATRPPPPSPPPAAPPAHRSPIRSPATAAHPGLFQLASPDPGTLATLHPASATPDRRTIRPPPHASGRRPIVAWRRLVTRHTPAPGCGQSPVRTTPPYPAPGRRVPKATGRSGHCRSQRWRPRCASIPPALRTRAAPVLPPCAARPADAQDPCASRRPHLAHAPPPPEEIARSASAIRAARSSGVDAANVVSRRAPGIRL